MTQQKNMTKSMTLAHQHKQGHEQGRASSLINEPYLAIQTLHTFQMLLSVAQKFTKNTATKTILVNRSDLNRNPGYALLKTCSTDVEAQS